MKKNGFTVVELVVSFALTMIIVIMLLQVVTTVKNLYISAGIKTEMLNKQALINRAINQEFSTKTINSALRCGKGCVTFVYEDMTSSKLVVDKTNNTIAFNNYSTKLVSGSKFGEINISTETLLGIDINKNNSILILDIPIVHQLLPDDNYGVNIVYQYDSRTTAIGNILLDDNDETNSYGSILLKGADNMIWMAGVAYEEPGWYTVTSDGKTIVSNNPAVTVSGNIDVNQLGLQTITYTWNVNGKSIVKKRNIYVTNTSLTYDYTGDYQVFTANVSGTYKVELWGAQGGGTKGGKGAYVSGNLELQENEELYVYVGENPTYVNGSCYQTNPNNSFNGSTRGSCAGAGGATDIRLKRTTNWYDSASLASRIMVAGAGGGAYYTEQGSGGYGGELFGGAGTGTNNANNTYYAGKGATQTQYSLGVPAPGTSLAGAGYYAGESGNGGNAGGGSSYISGHTGCVAIKSETDVNPKAGCSNGTSNQACSYHYSGKKFTNTKMIAGNKSMPTHNGKSNMVGNSGNGYAKITLISQQDATTINI